MEVCNGGTEITSNKEDPVAITIKCSRNNSTYKNELTTKYEDTKMVTFANDFSAGGKLKSLLQWWRTLLEMGLKLDKPENLSSPQSFKHMYLEKNFEKILK